MNLNPFAISNLLIILFFGPLFVFTCLCGRSKQAKIFSFYVLAHLLWGIGAFISSSTTNVAIANFFLKIGYGGAACIPVFLLHTVYSVQGKQNSKVVFTAYAIVVPFIVMAFAGLAFKTRWIFNSFYYFDGNIIFLIGLIPWFTWISLAHYKILKNYLSDPSERRKDKLLWCLGMIGLWGGTTNCFAIFRIPIYPYGNFLIPLTSLFLSYAIIKYQFLDIRLALKKSFLYSITITCIFSIYLFCILIFEYFLRKFFGYQSLISSLIAAIIIAACFTPLKQFLEFIINNFFYNRQMDDVAEQNDLLQQELTRREKYKMAAALAGGVAHEIKNPLTAIGTFIEQFPDKKDDPEFMNKFHRLATQELSRVRELSAQLMDFAKPAELKLSKFEVHSLLNDVLMLMNSRLKHQNINLNKQFSSTPLILTADRDQIKQVLLNLVLNALDVMPNGGMLTVTTRMDDTVMAQRAVPLQNNQILISISDTGSGISPEHQKKLFEPFFTTKPDGTGLGLSICRRIIQNHGGTISVESQLGQGTTFIMTLPLAAKEIDHG